MENEFERARCASSVYLIFAKTCVTKGSVPSSPSSLYEMTFSTEIKRALFPHPPTSIFQHFACLLEAKSQLRALRSDNGSFIGQGISRILHCGIYTVDTVTFFINCMIFLFCYFYKKKNTISSLSD